ncbi:hypothetical protein AG0111_0g5761 [Alternaria gaisen]|uniref:Uncharacterized protein n=1 Tax=Alternaria gaisen TaxID=167740 RepID=A0ACB6FNC1_9PLEO|nr:hypothetical protein AG0111_0g5761 [Alternaria gaisen]
MSPNDSDSDHDYNSSYDDEINLEEQESEEQESEEQEWNTPSSPGDMLLNNKQSLDVDVPAESVITMAETMLPALASVSPGMSTFSLSLREHLFISLRSRYRLEPITPQCDHP